MKRTKALLLAAGLGTRLRPLTRRVTKCLIPVAGRPLLDYWREQLVKAGITHVLINTHHLAEQVRAYIAQVNGQDQLDWSEAHEVTLLGSAGTLAANADFAADADVILVIYADNFSTIDIRELLAFHHQHVDPVSLLLFHTPDPRACGIVTLDDQQRVVRFEEKPAHPTSDLANAGIYVFDAEAYQQIAAMQVFDLGFDVLPQFIGRMRGWVGEGYHRDVGTYEAYATIQRFAVAQQPPRGVQPAVFLDRDGTLIEQVHYLSRPDQVKLLPGAGEAIQKLQQAGFLCVLVTNQSPIGQGLFTEQTLHAVHQALAEQLAVYQVKLDGIYYCPATALTKDRTLIDDYDRKPGPGLLFKAAADLKLDLMRSWVVGDMISDILAGYHAHCRGTVWVETGKGLEAATLPPEACCYTAANLSLAANHIIQQTTLSSSA